MFSVIASAISPLGSPPPLGFMIFQNMVWLTWPPPLLRTAARMSSGMALRSRMSSSADLLAQFGMLFDGGIQIFHVSAVMHVVVQGHRLLIDHRFECVVGIRQGGSS